MIFSNSAIVLWIHILVDMVLFITVLYQTRSTSNIIDVYDICHFSLPASDIDNIVMLMRKTNFKFLLDLNLQLRYGIQCNPTNAASLLAYVKKMNYSDVFNFELGNGVCVFEWEQYLWRLLQIVL